LITVQGQEKFSWEKLNYHNRQQEKKDSRIRQLKRVSFWLSLISILVMVYDLGFANSKTQEYNLANFYFCALFAGALMILARHIRGKSRDLRKVKIFDVLILFLFLSFSF